jgi:succinate dehydrogenase / fumarate reductase flavoprotein subunit/fumarate reductase flavoprotein subunit
MVERCAEYGFDLVGSRVEVSPSAHYHMGGVKIDIHCKSNIDGLFAAGEDAGGVHGANRLGGNGVADSIVFGARAGDSMAEYVSTKADPSYSRAQAEQLCKKWLAPLERKAGENPFELRAEMERTMWRKVGVVRNGAAMTEAVGELASVRERIENAVGYGSTIFNSRWNEAINTANLVVIAEMLTQSALLREESRGAHYRLDFPEQSGAWLKNILCLPVGGRGELKFSYQDVKFTRLQPPAEMVAAGGGGANREQAVGAK